MSSSALPRVVALVTAYELECGHFEVAPVPIDEMVGQSLLEPCWVCALIATPSIAAELGRLGGLKGGPARAKKLSPERRSEIARQAANTRWNGTANA